MAARQQPSATGPHCPRQPPLVTNHAFARWYDRYGGEGRALPTPATAWCDALVVELPWPWCLEGDEARYHPETHAVLCRRENHITTVYDTIGADAHHYVREVVEEQLDVELPDQEATT